MIDDLEARLDEARRTLSEDPAAAGEELRLLSENIALLQDRFR